MSCSSLIITTIYNPLNYSMTILRLIINFFAAPYAYDVVYAFSCITSTTNEQFKKSLCFPGFFQNDQGFVKYFSSRPTLNH